VPVTCEHFFIAASKVASAPAKEGEKLDFDGRDALTFTLLDEDDLLGGPQYPK
jgi:hypothetical protein